MLVIDSNGCQAQSAVYNFVYVGLNESSASAGLTLLPNPANSYIILKSTNNKSIEGHLKIWSISGELVFEKQITKVNQLQLAIEQWADGMYLIALIGSENTMRFKFIKE